MAEVFQRVLMILAGMLTGFAVSVFFVVALIGGWF